MEFKFIDKDERGEIWTTSIGGISYWFSHTHGGFGRGGDIHSGQQFNVILSGAFLVRQMNLYGESLQYVEAPSLIIVPPEIPHVFIAIKDAYMLEWHDHPLPPYSEKRFYEFYRRFCKCKQ